MIFLITQKVNSSQRLTNLHFIHFTNVSIVGWTFLTEFHFPLITLYDHNLQFLITLCITIRDEQDALFDFNTVRPRFTENTLYTWW